MDVPVETLLMVLGHTNAVTILANLSLLSALVTQLSANTTEFNRRMVLAHTATGATTGTGVATFRRRVAFPSLFITPVEAHFDLGSLKATRIKPIHCIANAALRRLGLTLARRSDAHLASCTSIADLTIVAAVHVGRPQHAISRTVTTSEACLAVLGAVTFRIRGCAIAITTSARRYANVVNAIVAKFTTGPCTAAYSVGTRANSAASIVLATWLASTLGETNTLSSLTCKRGGTDAYPATASLNAAVTTLLTRTSLRAWVCCLNDADLVLADLAVLARGAWAPCHIAALVFAGDLTLVLLFGCRGRNGRSTAAEAQQRDNKEHTRPTNRSLQQPHLFLLPS